MPASHYGCKKKLSARLAEKLSECVCRCESWWAHVFANDVSRRCVCMMVSISVTNYVHDLRDHWYTQSKHMAAHNFTVPVRQGLLSFIKSGGKSEQIFVHLSTANPKAHCPPCSAAAHAITKLLPITQSLTYTLNFLLLSLGPI